jgi:hypothetical protein
MAADAETCRQTPMMSRRGTSQVPNAQSITDEPATTACVAVVSGLGGSRRICAPARAAAAR